MSARTKARKRALDILFEADQRGLDPLDVLAVRRAAEDPPVVPYAVELVEGVAGNVVAIDALVGPRLSERWTLDRLPAVDRAVLRIAAYELRFRDDVPAAVAISEAVGLAGDLSTDESPAYVNGVLAALAAAPA